VSPSKVNLSIEPVPENDESPAASGKKHKKRKDPKLEEFMKIYGL
jgi:hypothetical protein